MKRLLAVESRLIGCAGCSKVLLWMFLVCRVVEGVKLLTVPSVFAVVAEPAAGTEGERQRVNPQRGLGQQGIAGSIENIRQAGRVSTGAGGHDGVALWLRGGWGNGYGSDHRPVRLSASGQQDSNAKRKTGSNSVGKP